VSVPTAGDHVPTVLEDPSGKRARWLRRAGRVVFLVFLAWLVATVLGGLGLIPVTGIPFAHVLRPSLGPPPLVKPLRPRQPSASDLRPALPAVTRKPTAPAATHGKSAVAPGQTKTSTTHGKSVVAPGHTRQVLLAAYAFRLDNEPLRPLWALPLQQFVYRQLMYVVIIESTVSALVGARAHWRHLTRTGEVDVKTA
jgi:hypothetical protein